MKNRIAGFLEGIVTLAIILVLAQTLLEEIMVFAGVSWSLRKVFIFTSFSFDLFFTIEFLVRSWMALGKKQFRPYFFQGYGWVDFVASVPLLTLTSAPEMMAYFNGVVLSGAGGLMGILKVVKAVRIARVLRLLRILRIFQRIRFADSLMVQRHTVRIVTTIASIMIFTNMAMSAVFTFVDSFGIEQLLVREQHGVLNSLKETKLMGDAAVKELGINNPMILAIKNDGTAIYSKTDDEHLKKYYGPGDYVVFTEEPYTVWFDVQPFAVTQSRLNLTIFTVVLAMISILIITYGTHFALTVSDPINVMMRGMKERSYNLEVRIQQKYAADEVFLLAEIYNDEFLPMKARNENDKLDITLADISDLLKP